MSAVLSGVFRVTRNADLRSVNDKPVATVLLAYNWGSKREETGKRESQFVEATMWGERAVALAPQLTRGKALHISLSDVHVEKFTRSGGSQDAKLVAKIERLDFLPMYLQSPGAQQ